MKLSRFHCSLFLAFVVLGCTHQPPQPRSIVVQDGWRVDEVLFEAEHDSPLAAMNLPAHRTGVTENGFTYTIYPDGSAGLRLGQNAVAEWSIDCSKDKMSDQRNCTVTSSKNNIQIMYGPAGVAKQICIIDHDFPNRLGAIRIDNEEPISTDTDGCISGKFENKLTQASSVTTRSVKWPYDHHRDRKNPLKGLKTAIGLKDYVLSNIDDMSFNFQEK